MNVISGFILLFASTPTNVHSFTHQLRLGYSPLPPCRNGLLSGQGLLSIEASRSLSDTTHSVGLLWTSDHSDAHTSTWQHTLTRARHPCRQRYSNPQSQQASDRNPTPQTARSPGSAGFRIRFPNFFSYNFFLPRIHSSGKRNWCTV